MEKKLLTANEAKALTESSNCQINRIAKEIEYAAKENRTTLVWCVYETSRVVVASLVTQLKGAGYSVVLNYEEDDKPDHVTSLTISW